MRSLSMPRGRSRALRAPALRASSPCHSRVDDSSIDPGIGLAAVVGIEKYWVRGEGFARGVGVAALIAAVTVIWVPELAPGLQPTDMPMGAM